MRHLDGSSYFDQPPTPEGPWPRRRVIWSCQMERGPLLIRYFVWQTPFFALYLHKLCASDEDRALHDHPWSFISFLPTSGYFEHTEDATRVVKRWRRRFSLAWRPAEFRHRLELVKFPTWSVVLRFRRRRDWGFITPTGWMNWRAYGKEWCD